MKAPDKIIPIFNPAVYCVLGNRRSKRICGAAGSSLLFFAVTLPPQPRINRARRRRKKTAASPRSRELPPHKQKAL